MPLVKLFLTAAESLYIKEGDASSGTVQPLPHIRPKRPPAVSLNVLEVGTDRTPALPCPKALFISLQHIHVQ